MPSRREVSVERRNQIIDAALQVFATKGFSATTNRDIAEAAGINSPGLIYHYFTDQQDLFRAVLQERAPILRLSMMESPALLAKSPHEVLTLFATTLLETVSEPTTRQLIRLTMGEAMRQPEIAQMVYHAGSSHFLAFLYTYFEQLMTQGKMRQADLGATVRSFAGPFFVYLITTLILNIPDERTPDAQTLVATVVETFLCGMEPE